MIANDRLYGDIMLIESTYRIQSINAVIKSDINSNSEISDLTHIRKTLK